ncbi:uncharacterized protein LOC132061425 [Lycium ferocissimum]|uniref:uncharacterized protein LOC132061425 n=1 Tax=Lycium ferocissimum TaxID=112874 RepID=UPI002814FF8A|nr:uncharacterized protein LOC132061425 [Lycium ferocissimum]
MVRLLISRNNGDQSLCSMPLAIGLFLSIIAVIALCAKHGRSRASRKYHMANEETNEERILASKSPLLTSPKQLITTISTKTMPKKYGEKSNVIKNGSNEREGFGHEGGLWQKQILMGERCQPPQFSGVIYYDPFGNRVSELPRSPRASPMARSYAC